MLSREQRGKIKYLLWWDFESCSPHVNLLVNIHTRNDKEHSGSPGPSCYKSAQSEDDSSLILLDNLNIQHFNSFWPIGIFSNLYGKEKRDRQSDKDHEN